MALLELTAHSQTLEREVDFLVILPENASGLIGMESKESACCKTLYLLHGISGNDCAWEYNGIAEDLSIRFNLAIIMFTCGNDFYLDREATGRQYCQFAGREAVEELKGYAFVQGVILDICEYGTSERYV